MDRSVPFLIVTFLVLIAGLGYWFAHTAQAPAPLENNDEVILYDATVETRLDRMGYFTNNIYGEVQTELYFDFYIDRTDLGLSEADNDPFEYYLSDLPEAQQLSALYVRSEPDGTENWCERGFAPHRCEVSGPGTYYLEMEFLDGGHATTTIEIPEIPLPELPALTAPTSTPEQNTPLQMTFTDTNPTEYYVEVNLCTFYANDGINPCLGGEEFWVVRDEIGDWVVYETFYNPRLSYSGNDQTITVESELSMEFDASALYLICAYSEGEFEGIKTYSEACDYHEFVR